MVAGGMELGGMGNLWFSELIAELDGWRDEAFAHPEIYLTNRPTHRLLISYLSRWRSTRYPQRFTGRSPLYKVPSSRYSRLV